MENMPSGLPHVPFQVPIPGMTFEQYLHYQSWRIEFQILATIWRDWKQSTSNGEKEMYRNRIISKLVEINQRAACFPVQPLPEDIPTLVEELMDSSGRPGMISMPMLIRKLW